MKRHEAKDTYSATYRNLPVIHHVCHYLLAPYKHHATSPSPVALLNPLPMMFITYLSPYS